MAGVLVRRGALDGDGPRVVDGVVDRFGRTAADQVTQDALARLDGEGHDRVAIEPRATSAG